MKFLNITALALTTALALHLLSNPVLAATALQDYRKDVKDARTDYREEVKDARSDFKEEIKEKIASKVGEIKKMLGVRTTFSKATVKTINGGTLTVEKDSNSYTINTGTFDKCTTQYRRRFWGKGSLSEISVGDSINVFGMWANEAKTSVNACLIRDISIQKRYGVFFGTILSVTSNGFTMSTVSEKRANQTVTISSSSKLINRKEQSISLSDIQVGHKVRVSGLWDNQLNTVTEVTKVKDFTLPVIPTPTPKK